MVVALAAPGLAGADSFSLLSGDVAVDVQPDGSLGISERLESPSRVTSTSATATSRCARESLVLPSVAERGLAYRQGTQTELARARHVRRHGAGTDSGSSGTSTPEIRHAPSRSRTPCAVSRSHTTTSSTSTSRSGGISGTRRSTDSSRSKAPGRILRGWGKPVWVRGDVELTGRRATLRAVSVPPHQFVELRTLIPRSAFSSTLGMKVVRGNAFDRIAAEEKADAETYEQDQEQIDRLKAHPLLVAAIVLALRTLPALLVIAAVYWLFGRERRTAYDREYEQAADGHRAGARPALLRQGGEAGSYEFTATLFDLIRRGIYKSEPTTTERPIWGGLRSETVSDLQLSAGAAQDLRPWERDVADVVDAVLDGSSSGSHASATASRTIGNPCIRASPPSGGSRTRDPAAALVLVDRSGATHHGGRALRSGRRSARRPRSGRMASVYPRYSDVLLVGAAICSLGNAVLIVASVIFGRRLCAVAHRRPRRRPSWDAFLPLPLRLPTSAGGATRDTRALGALPRVRDCVRDCRARAAGCAAPYAEAIHQASSIYWISSSGDLGSGATSLSIGDLSSGFGDALAPPNSGAGGGGGGFSGGRRRRRRGRGRRVRLSLVRPGPKSHLVPRECSWHPTSHELGRRGQA